MKILGNEIKPGMIIEHKNDLWEVLKTQHVKPGKGGAFNQVEIKSLNKNTKLNERFRSTDSVEKAFFDEETFNFLYEDENYYYFINQKSFEQININKSIVGDKGKLLTENLEVTINFYNENPLFVKLPNQVTCKINSTDASLKGQTVSSSYKPAILDNQLKIQVPPFIESGDSIIVDTRTIEYVKKV
jgi:elongation factor P|tara:strand:+ start:63 stop:623 length:561 start_codon:yes stop_codon:yes gene_type:complete